MNPSAPDSPRYDIIGDIHGEAGKLHSLLRKLSYEAPHGMYRHPEGRQAIFVGDLIDKGPQQLETIEVVRAMVSQGTALAVMGNHEFNAIAWHLPDPQKPGEFLRTHEGELGGKNREQHSAFLTQVGENSARHADIVRWLLELPLWLDLPGLRVVHACWHEQYMAELEPVLRKGKRLTASLVERASRPDTMVFRTVEGLTKGLEVQLPAGVTFVDKYGTLRDRARIAWWNSHPDATYREIALLAPEQQNQLPDTAASCSQRPLGERSTPVFFGHYWRIGIPVLQTETAACVDYSAAMGGPLVAYRWHGEQKLDASHFVRSE